MGALDGCRWWALDTYTWGALDRCTLGALDGCTWGLNEADTKVQDLEGKLNEANTKELTHSRISPASTLLQTEDKVKAVIKLPQQNGTWCNTNGEVYGPTNQCNATFRFPHSNLQRTQLIHTFYMLYAHARQRHNSTGYW